ncbi:TPA: gamma-glutamyltransferase family protein [Klebsiella pneumoniae]
MHSSNVSTHGMAVAPHHLASQSALAILREGGSAIEAMVAAAAAIAVVYPHMNGLGGDGFWLIVPPEGDPIAIDASGAAGSLATLEAYAGQRHIPHRGPQAALTVAGTVSGWDEALRISRDLTGRALPVARLLADADDAQTVHRIVEATKRAFALRDAHITDPRHLDVDVQQLLTPEALQPLADSIDDASASPWGGGKGPGDTVWMGVVDNSGLAVSFIQSIYHEFGSGVVLPDTGIVWQNRGAAFSLDPQHLLALAPGKQPFHTLNPAAARLNDGRVMVYGSMGGDGQPQTQAALFTRYILQGVPLQESISRPRWLLGRTWGQSSDSLKLEGRFAPACIARLRELGHDVEVLADFSEAMGHAGAIVRHPNGLLEGATDPRSNGAAAGY